MHFDMCRYKENEFVVPTLQNGCCACASNSSVRKNEGLSKKNVTYSNNNPRVPPHNSVPANLKALSPRLTLNLDPGYRQTLMRELQWAALQCRGIDLRVLICQTC